MQESQPPSSAQSVGARVHLLRLAMHWSAEECAYRITIAANNYITPETWLVWERCSDLQAAENGLLAALKPISQLFAADLAWLESGTNDELTDPSGAIVQFPNRPHKLLS